MFERFTERARRVLVLAQEQSTLLGHDFLGSEHILLGVLSEGEGVAAALLRDMGLDLDEVRRRVEQAVGRGTGDVTALPPFTPEAKKILELSLREALVMGDNYIGTEHLLLGLLRATESVASRVLVESGLELDEVRQKVVQLPARTAGVPDRPEEAPPRD